MKKVLILNLILILFFPATFNSQQVRNISAENKISYTKKMEELQKIAFWGRRKGRYEFIPADIGQFLVIQRLISTEKEILQQLTSSYLNSRRHIDEITKNFISFLKEEETKEIYKVANDTLLKTYDLSKEIKKSKSFLELFQKLNQRKFLLDTIPYHYFLSLKAMYEIDKLCGESKIEEIITIFKDFSEKEGDILFLKEKFSNFIRNLAELEFKYVGEIPEKEEKTLSLEEVKGEFLTYTIRTNDGLLILYLEESAIRKVKEIIEGVSQQEFLQKERLVEKIKEVKGIKKIEIFEKSENIKKRINSASLRGAIMENALPIIEGIENIQAEKILKVFGWDVYFLNDEKEIEEKLKEISQKEKAKFVILTGLKEDSRVYWGIW